MLAIEAGLPVVPIAIVGTRHVMRKGRLTVEPGDVVLTVHAPIDSAARAAHPSIDDARTLAADVHAIIRAARRRRPVETRRRPSRYRLTGRETEPVGELTCG